MTAKPTVRDMSELITRLHGRNSPMHRGCRFLVEHNQQGIQKKKGSSSDSSTQIRTENFF